MSDTSIHTVPYRTYGLVFILLLVLTATSVAIAQIELSRWATAFAMLLAFAQSAFIVTVFMHPKLRKKVHWILAIIILLVVFALVALAFLNY
jgi:caa(3)-type oxidase subunit IV